LELLHAKDQLPGTIDFSLLLSGGLLLSCPRSFAIMAPQAATLASPAALASAAALVWAAIASSER